jgi:glycosyltransferase involved in cell wall biosynthesis
MMQYLQKILLNNLPVSWLRKRSRVRPGNSVLPESKKLIIDVSSIAQSDAKTGIQRVVRNLYQQLLSGPLTGYQICPVMATRGQFYRYVPVDFLQLASPAIADTRPIQINPGDIFLGLDLSAHLIPHHLSALLAWKKQGLRMTFLIYDLLPVLQPNWFNTKVSQNFKKWLRALAILADNSVAISGTVQGDFHVWMRDKCKLSVLDLPCAVMSLGAELNTEDSTETDVFDGLPMKFDEQKFILMVGTVEPRKGHEDVLNAFELLWEKGEQWGLVIVGKQGWKVESLTERLRAHPESKNRLHWFNNANDEVLRSLYQRCQGVIVASKGEGFGLPLIEAAYFNKPVLARDIPVFREISGNNVNFFSNKDTNELFHLLLAWLQNLNAEYCKSDHTSWITWRESCDQLIAALIPVTGQQMIATKIDFNSTENEITLGRREV